jgi:hypothetical protein
MPDRAPHQVPVRSPAQIAGLVYDARGVLSGINALTAVAANLDLIPHSVQPGAKFRLVVERGNHHVPALPPLRVIAVMADDEALDAIVPRVNSRHSPRIVPPSGIIIIAKAPGRQGRTQG